MDPGNHLAEMNTLYFLGNGFDIAHRIESRYSDFRDFMNESKEYDDLVIMLEELYGCTVENLWREFETALGLITGKEIYEDAVDSAGKKEYTGNTGTVRVSLTNTNFTN